MWDLIGNPKDRFSRDMAHIRKDLKFSGNKDWSKIHKKNFEKFDSLDVYLDKKKKRAEEITASVKKAKNILAEVQASVNKLKSHKTPTTENMVS